MSLITFHKLVTTRQDGLAVLSSGWLIPTTHSSLPLLRWPLLTHCPPPTTSWCSRSLGLGRRENWAIRVLIAAGSQSDCFSLFCSLLPTLPLSGLVMLVKPWVCILVQGNSALSINILDACALWPSYSIPRHLSYRSQECAQLHAYKNTFSYATTCVGYVKINNSHYTCNILGYT